MVLSLWNCPIKDGGLCAIAPAAGAIASPAAATAMLAVKAAAAVLWITDICIPLSRGITAVARGLEAGQRAG